MSDPYREPDNSTVDDWFGQSVERDADLAEALVAETGDEEQAAERFEEEATGAHEQEQRRRGSPGESSGGGETRADSPGKPRPSPQQARENAELDPPA
jgi:hypothetical protein